MSRPPLQASQQQQQIPSQHKQQANASRMSQQSNERSNSASKSPYTNQNYLGKSNPQLKANQQQQQQSQSGQEFSGSLDSIAPSNMSKKPSLLSGYHNPYSTDRNDILAGLSPLALSNALSRYYVPTPGYPNTKPGSLDSTVLAAIELSQQQAQQGNSSLFNSPFFNGMSNASPNPDEKTQVNKSRQMSITTNQLKSARGAQFAGQPSMHSPGHQAMLGPAPSFSPAVIAAAASALNMNAANNPQYSQLIHQHQLQQQQISQLQQFQAQFQQSLAINAEQPAAFVKKEPTNVAAPPAAPTTPAPPPNPVSTQQVSSAASTPPATSSSSYVPQVEAISPTPEDQKENSNLQDVKEKIITEICKVEKDIASTQYQFDMLEKKQVNWSHTIIFV